MGKESRSGLNLPVFNMQTIHTIKFIGVVRNK